ncbi:MAG: protein translocase subunit SecD, partial [Pseudomonadota bacterium]
FTATFVSRGMVNLMYGSRRRLDHVPIGKIWIPKHSLASDKAISHEEGETTEDTTVSGKLRINEQNKANIQSEASSPVETIADTDNIVDEAKIRPDEKAITKTKSKRKKSDVKQPKQQ